MVKADMLDGFSDEDVREVKTLCDKVLKSRDDERKAKALDEAREKARTILAAAGLTLDDLVKGRSRGKKGPAYKGGHSYQHPTNKALMWQGKGKKPGWLVELESRGQRAVELPMNVGVPSA